MHAEKYTLRQVDYFYINNIFQTDSLRSNHLIFSILTNLLVDNIASRNEFGTIYNG